MSGEIKLEHVQALLTFTSVKLLTQVAQCTLMIVVKLQYQPTLLHIN